MCVFVVLDINAKYRCVVKVVCHILLVIVKIDKIVMVENGINGVVKITNGFFVDIACYSFGKLCRW